MSLFRYVVGVLAVLFFISCQKNLEEGDRNTFTVKGTLFDGYSENPLANEQVYLEAEKAGFPTGGYEIIAEGETDAQGNFSLTYKRLKGTERIIRLYTSDPRYDDFPIELGDVNENYNLYLPTIPYAEIDLNVNFNSDSLIVQPYGLVETEIPRYDDNLELSVEGEYLVLNKTSSSINIKCAYIGQYVNSDMFAWAITVYESKKALRNTIETLDTSEYQTFRFDLEGFPNTDEISITVD